MQSTIWRPSDNLKVISSGWLMFLSPVDEYTHAEAMIYQDSDGSYYVGWDLTAVGLVTWVGAFDSIAACEEWLEEHDFDCYSG